MMGNVTVTHFMKEMSMTKKWVIVEGPEMVVVKEFDTLEAAINRMDRHYTAKKAAELQPAIGKVLPDGDITFEW